MIASNKNLLENTFLVSEAESLKDAGFISKEQFLQVRIAKPVLKSQHNLFFRFLFFLLGSFLYSSVVGVFALITADAYDSVYPFMFLVFAAIGFGISELLANQNYFSYGLDDAFILGFQMFICIAIGAYFENLIPVYLTMAVVGTFACIRYIHTISALIALIGVAGFFASLVLEAGIIPKVFLPFVMLVLAIGGYFLCNDLKTKQKTAFYDNALEVFYIFNLVLAYCSMNYFVVRELSQELLGFRIEANQDIDFAWLFYVLTFAIPVFYIGYSLILKNRSMLIIGLIAFAASVATIRYYYSFFPAEILLILGGIVLFAIAFFSIRFLKHKENGITFLKDRFSNDNSMLYAQAIVINSQMHSAPVSETSQMPFGGGGFSGGGAGESF